MIRWQFWGLFCDLINSLSWWLIWSLFCNFFRDLFYRCLFWLIWLLFLWLLFRLCCLLRVLLSNIEYCLSLLQLPLMLPLICLLLLIFSSSYLTDLLAELLSAIYLIRVFNIELASLFKLDHLPIEPLFVSDT